MPVVTQNPQPIAGQVNVTSPVASAQLSFRKMTGEVLQWNPDLPVTLAQRFLANAYREILDRRSWYGLKIKGQIVVPNVYTTGTSSVTLGSTSVTLLNGGTVTPSMVGQQYRAGFTSMFYTIVAVDTVANALTLELPWGNPSMTSVGYQILTNIVSLGPNIKYIYQALNQRQGYRLFINMPVDVINMYDTWRTTQGWTFMMANREPSATGEPLFELYPSPAFQQAFPYIAYIQPPDLKDDDDTPVPLVPSDAIVTRAIADALLFRGPKLNKYYDPQTAKMKMAEYGDRIQQMMRVDDNLNLTDLRWDFSKYPMSRQGSLFLQSHASNWPSEEF